MFIIFLVILLTFHPLGKEAAMFTQIKTTYDLTIVFDTYFFKNFNLIDSKLKRNTRSNKQRGPRTKFF